MRSRIAVRKEVQRRISRGENYMNNPVKGNARSILFFALAAFIVVVSSSRAARAQDGEHGNMITAQLISFNQVPAVLAQSSGSFTAEINSDGTISFSLTYANMSSSVVQAHIHFGASKTNGGVMVFLCGGPKPECPASGTVTGTLAAADVSVLPAANPDSVIPQGVQPGDFAGMLSAIRSGNSYVNVHTTNFPNGEIRGQVHVGRSDPALAK
jgi:CHRD domain